MSVMTDIRRGDIWYADDSMGPRDPNSRVVYGGRPVAVISSRTPSEEVMSVMTDIRRGDIWYADDSMGPRDPNSRVVYGGRPVAVISSNTANFRNHVIMVVPITSNLRVYEGAGSVDIPARDANGLRCTSRALTNQITSVDRSALRNWMGELTPEEMAALEQAARAALGL